MFLKKPFTIAQPPKLGFFTPHRYTFASMKHLLLILAFLCTFPVLAQTTTPATYEFLTVLEAESQASSFAKMIFAPAFQGKSEIALEGLPGALSSKYWPTYQRNLQVVNQQLEAVTAAGWELVHVSSSAASSGHEYLFRRLKK